MGNRKQKIENWKWEIQNGKLEIGFWKWELEIGIGN